jgi:hypothetical protein
MPHRPIAMCLNDHLAEATFGAELTRGELW